MLFLRKVFFILLTTLVCVSCLYAQAPDTLWTKYYNTDQADVANKILATSDGGFVVAGANRHYEEFDGNVIVLKTDANGDTEWHRVFDTFGISEATDILELDNGDFFIVGNTYQDGSTSPLFLRLNSDGDITENIELADTSLMTINRIVKNDNLNFTIMGRRGIDSSNYIAEITSSGNILWINVLEYEDYTDFRSLAKKSNGGYIMGGFLNPVTSDTTSAYLINIDSNGEVIWEQNYAFQGNDNLQTVLETSDNCFVGIGTSATPEYEDSRLMVFKTAISGDTLWTRQFEMDGEAAGSDIKESDNGDLFLLGSTTQGEGSNIDFFIMRLNGSTGQLMWSQKYGNDNYELGTSMWYDENNGFAITGLVLNLVATEESIFITRLGTELDVIESTNLSPVSHNINSIYPNPFNPSTSISLSLARPSQLNVSVYDMLGRRVAILANGAFSQGTLNLNFDASQLASGTYYLRVNIPGGMQEVRKMVLMK